MLTTGQIELILNADVTVRGTKARLAKELKVSKAAIQYVLVKYGKVKLSESKVKLSESKVKLSESKVNQTKLEDTVAALTKRVSELEAKLTHHTPAPHSNQYEATQNYIKTRGWIVGTQFGTEVIKETIVSHDGRVVILTLLNPMTGTTRSHEVRVNG